MLVEGVSVFKKAVDSSKSETPVSTNGPFNNTVYSIIGSKTKSPSQSWTSPRPEKLKNRISDHPKPQTNPWHDKNPQNPNPNPRLSLSL